MNRETKVIKLDSGVNVITNVNTLYHTGLNKSLISLWFKHHENNEVGYSNLGDAAASERPIANEGMQMYGDLVFVASWGDGGFGIYRINDDGSFSNLYHDRYPMSGTNDVLAVAIDTINNIAICGTYQAYGFSRYDFSGALNGGTTVTKLTEWNDTNTDIPTSRDDAGHAYTSGLVNAGEYTYWSPDAGPSAGIYRMSSSGVFEEIPVTNHTDGSRYGALFYSEATDRVYLQSFYDYELDVVLNASTAGATAVGIPTDLIPGFDNDGYIHGIVEHDDNPNHIYFGSGYQFGLIDITACLVPGANGVVPTLIGDYLHRQNDGGVYSNARFAAPLGTSDYLILLADRGWNRRGGWIDTENMRWVNQPQHSGPGQSADHDWLYYDYQPRPLLVTTDNGSKYWVYSGYGYDGYLMRSFNENDATKLFEAGELIIGSYQLDSTDDIKTFEWIDLSLHMASTSGSSISCMISNDSGSTWETYTPSSIHVFSSTGNSVRIKFTMTGNGYSSGYLETTNVFVIILSNTDGTEESQDIQHID